MSASYPPGVLRIYRVECGQLAVNVPGTDTESGVPLLDGVIPFTVTQSFTGGTGISCSHPSSSRVVTVVSAGVTLAWDNPTATTSPTLKWEELSTGRTILLYGPDLPADSRTLYLPDRSGTIAVYGALFQHYADSTVGGAEADIYSDTLAAGQLGANGDKINTIHAGNFVTLGTESVQLKLYFGGTAIWDSTGIAVTSGTTSWRIAAEVIRVSSSVVRYSVSLNTSGASGFVYCTVGELTGLTLANTQIVKTTGTSSGVGSGSGDIVGKMAQVHFTPAA